MSKCGLNVNVSVVNTAFLCFFAVFDLSPLTVCINCSFLTFIFAVLLPVLSKLLIMFISTTFFYFSRWRPSANVDFLNVRNFNCWFGSEGQYASSCQMLCRSVKPLPRYRYFWNFRMVAWWLTPSWIF